MKYFKKYPVFFTLLIVLLAAFAALLTYDFVLFNANAKSSAKEQSARRKFLSATQADPGPEALAMAKENVAQLEKKLGNLDENLTREITGILKSSPPPEVFAFVEHLRAIVEKWKLNAKQRNIGFAEKFGFSYSVYLDSNNQPKAEELKPLWKQLQILDVILNKLYSAKNRDIPMGLLSIQREDLTIKEVASAQTGRSRTQTRVTKSSDTFEIDDNYKNISARKAGSVNALGYKIVFASYTDTMRKFLNALNDDKSMLLVVRSVEVKPFTGTLPTSTPAALATTDADTSSLADAFASVDTAKDPNADAFLAAIEPDSKVAAPDPVISENISEFTIVVEYVELEKSPEKSSPEVNSNKAEE